MVVSAILKVIVYASWVGWGWLATLATIVIVLALWLVVRLTTPRKPE